MASIVEYEPEARSSGSRPITAGDVIRCASFEWGLQIVGEPMSITRPGESEIEIVGRVTLPLWL